MKISGVMLIFETNHIKLNIIVYFILSHNWKMGGLTNCMIHDCFSLKCYNFHICFKNNTHFKGCFATQSSALNCNNKPRTCYTRWINLSQLKNCYNYDPLKIRMSSLTVNTIFCEYIFSHSSVWSVQPTLVVLLISLQRRLWYQDVFNSGAIT